MSAPIVGEVQLTVLPNVAGFQERVNQAIKKQVPGGQYSLPAPKVPDMQVHQVHFEADVSGFERSLGKIVALAGTAAEVAGNALTEGLSKVIGLAKESFVDFNSTTQQVTLGLTSLTGSASMAQSELANLSKFAASTPFRYKDIMQWAESLQAVGYNANTLIPTLTAMGDAVSRMGGGSEQMGGLVSGVLKQIATTGQFTGGDIQWFRQYGLDVGKMLMPTLTAQGFLPKGANEAQLNQAIAAGGFSVPTSMVMPQLLSAIEGSAGGMMQQDVTKTFKGAMSNIHDAFDQLIGRTTGGGFDKMTSGIASFSSEFLKFANAVHTEGVGGAISGLFPPAMQATISSIVSSLDRIIQDFVALSKAVAPDVLMAMAGVLATIASGLRSVLDVIRPLTDAMEKHAGMVRIAVAAWAALALVSTANKAGWLGESGSLGGGSALLGPAAVGLAVGSVAGNALVNRYVNQPAAKGTAPEAAIAAAGMHSTNIAQIVSDIGKLNKAGDMVTEALNKSGGSLNPFDLKQTAQLAHGQGDIEKQDKALGAHLKTLEDIAHMAGSKNLDGIGDLFKKSGFNAGTLQTAMDRLSTSLHTLDPGLDLTKASVQDVANAFANAGATAQTYGIQLTALQQIQTEVQSMQANSKTMAAAMMAPSDLSSAYLGGNVGMQAGVIGLQQTIASSRGHLTTDVAQGFIGLRPQIQSAIEGWKDLGMSTDEVQAKMQGISSSIAQTAANAGMSASQIKDMMGALGLLPDEIQQMMSGNQYEVAAAKNEMELYAKAIGDAASSTQALNAAWADFTTTYGMSVAAAAQWYGDQAAQHSGTQQGISDKEKQLQLIGQQQQFQLAVTKNYQDQLGLINAQMGAWTVGSQQWNQLFEQRQNLMIQIRQYEVTSFQSWYGQIQGVINQLNQVRSQMMGNIWQPFQMPDNPILSAGTLTKFSDIEANKVQAWSAGLKTLESWGLTRGTEMTLGLNAGPQEMLQVQQLIKAGPAAIARLQSSVEQVQGNAQTEAYREQAEIIAQQIGLVLEAFLAANNATIDGGTAKAVNDVMTAVLSGGAVSPQQVNTLAAAVAKGVMGRVHQGKAITGS